MNPSLRPVLLSSLALGGVFLASIASGDTPKVATEPPRPKLAVEGTPLQLRTRSAVSLDTVQRAAVQKAVKASVAVYAKDKNVSKALLGGAGLTGAAAFSYHTKMVALVSTNAPSVAARYGIENGILFSNETDSAGSGTCPRIIKIDLAVKNRGVGVGAEVPGPTLEAIETGSTPRLVGSANVPKLAANQSSTVRLTLKTNGPMAMGACLPVDLDLELTFIGVANAAVFELQVKGSNATVTSFPLGTTLSGGSDFPGGFPDNCNGLPKCPGSSMCALPGIDCP